MVAADCANEAAEGGACASSNKEADVRIIPAQPEKEENIQGRGSTQGTKLSPICDDEEMKGEAKTTAELKKLCFPDGFSLIEAKLEVVPGVTSASFSSNSTNTISKHNLYSWPEGDNDMVLTKLMEKSLAINSTVADRTISRHGRSTQRWLMDSGSSKVTRLVTGCVPILAGENIMLVSASKKNEWILPKGGWEMDEEMEGSAIRETFEEAGVIGILGPKLSEVEYETRKARERRLAREEKSKTNPQLEGQFSSGWSDVSQLSEDDHLPGEKHEQTLCDERQVAVPASPSGKTNPLKLNSQEVSTGLQARTKNGTEQTELNVSGMERSPGKSENGERHTPSKSTTVYSHVCVSLFPLYVTDVMSTWPESGRLRKFASIDEAIELLAARPEMQSILREVKTRGLHRV